MPMIWSRIDWRAAGVGSGSAILSATMPIASSNAISTEASSVAARPAASNINGFVPICVAMRFAASTAALALDVIASTTGLTANSTFLMSVLS